MHQSKYECTDPTCAYQGIPRSSCYLFLVEKEKLLVNSNAMSEAPHVRELSTRGTWKCLEAIKG